MRASMWTVLVLTVFLLGSFGIQLSRAYSQNVVQLPDPKASAAPGSGLQTAVFAGGCFWGVEAVFEELRGVKDVVSGYAGGGAASAKYDVVSGGGTQHAESVKVTFDPTAITYSQLLKVFFSVAHDPTQLNRQGPDRGYQYRSAIFPVNEAQRKAAESYIEQLQASKVFSKPVVTRVSPLSEFYPAESYHQDYMRHHPYEPYIVVNDAPKLARLKVQFADLLKPAASAQQR